MSKLQRCFGVIISISFLFFAPGALAAGLVPNCAGATCGICHLMELISNITLFLVKSVMPPLAGLLFLIGGIMMVAAAGSEERYKKGRQVLINTAIGAAIVLISWLIVNSLITTIGNGTNVPGFSTANWWHPSCTQ